MLKRSQSKKGILTRNEDLEIVEEESHDDGDGGQSGQEEDEDAEGGGEVEDDGERREEGEEIDKSSKCRVATIYKTMQAQVMSDGSNVRGGSVCISIRRKHFAWNDWLASDDNMREVSRIRNSQKSGQSIPPAKLALFNKEFRIRRGEVLTLVRTAGNCDLNKIFEMI